MCCQICPKCANEIPPFAKGICYTCNNPFATSSKTPNTKVSLIKSADACQIICIGHGTWCVTDDHAIVPNNVELLFYCEDDKRTAGQARFEYDTRFTKRGGDVVKNYRLWAMVGEVVNVNRNEFISVGDPNGFNNLRNNTQYILTSEHWASSTTLAEIFGFMNKAGCQIKTQLLWLACRETVPDNTAYSTCFIAGKPFTLVIH